MKTKVVVSLTLTLLVGGSLLSPYHQALAAPVPLFEEHSIDGNFNGARSVYATDVDGDGDIGVLGAAWYANDIS